MRFKAWKIFSGINCDDNSSSFKSTVMILSTVRNHLQNFFKLCQKLRLIMLIKR